MINPRSRIQVSALLAFAALCIPPAARIASAQEPARHTLELGAVGQSTADLLTPPITVIYGVNPPIQYNGTPNEQGFGGPELGYRYAFTRNFSLDARVGYLFGHQPTVFLTGGNELMAHIGVRASVPLGRRFTFFARVAPGVSSFSQADRYLQTSTNPSQKFGRITHFSVENSVGLTYRLAKRTALSFDVGQLIMIEGDEVQGSTPAIPCASTSTVCGGGGKVVYPGNVELHLMGSIGLEHSFGRSFDSATPSAGRAANNLQHIRNELLVIFVNQPQTYLSQSFLTASSGLGIDASHSFTSWLDIDGSALMLPGGDAATFQDGGSKTEVFLGLKAGIRRPHFALFGKFRPGLVTSPDTLTSEATPEKYVRNINFVSDSGAVIEIYPTAQNFVMRFDLGEVSTRYGAVNVTTPNGIAVQPTQYGQAGLFTAGVGWRF